MLIVAKSGDVLGCGLQRRVKVLLMRIIIVTITR
jgi:hypothetical protein